MAPSPVVRRPATAAPEPVRRLRRGERREQILVAATTAFARSGFAATSLDDIAAEAGVSRAILYRHFDSKTDLYRAILDRVSARLGERVEVGELSGDIIDGLLGVAAEDPDGFRLLFRYAAREPEFRDVTDAFDAVATDIARRHLASRIPDPAWVTWAAELLPTLTVEAVIAWLDAGCPDPGQAAGRVRRAIHGVIEAARRPPER